MRSEQFNKFLFSYVMLFKKQMAIVALTLVLSFLLNYFFNFPYVFVLFISIVLFRSEFKPAGIPQRDDFLQLPLSFGQLMIFLAFRYIPILILILFGFNFIIKDFGATQPNVILLTLSAMYLLTISMCISPLVFKIKKMPIHLSFLQTFRTWNYFLILIGTIVLTVEIWGKQNFFLGLALLFFAMTSIWLVRIFMNPANYFNEQKVYKKMFFNKWKDIPLALPTIAIFALLTLI